MSISVQIGGQYRYMTTSVHMRSISVHVIFVVQFRYIIMSISVCEQYCSWMLNLCRWDLYIRHFFVFASSNWNCDWWRRTLRRLSRCKRSRWLCVVGCLAKPVCISKYCDIKRLPSTASLLAIPVGLHRARQRPAYLTPISLIPAHTRVRIFRDLKTPPT